MRERIRERLEFVTKAVERQDLLRVDPDTVQVDPDEWDKPKPADAPLKDQGDALSE